MGILQYVVIYKDFIVNIFACDTEYTCMDLFYLLLTYKYLWYVMLRNNILWTYYLCWVDSMTCIFASQGFRSRSPLSSPLADWTGISDPRALDFYWMQLLLAASNQIAANNRSRKHHVYAVENVNIFAVYRVYFFYIFMYAGFFFSHADNHILSQSFSLWW